MSMVRWTLLALLLTATVYTVGRHFHLWGRASISRVTFRCPMHPAIVAAEQTPCSVCGMDLVAAPSPAAGGIDTHKPSAGSPPGLVAVSLEDAEARRLGLRTARVARVTRRVRRAFAGVVAVDERRIEHVQPRFSGWIERVAPLATGAFVKKGTVLAWIFSNEVFTAQEEMLRTLATAQRWIGPELAKVRRGLETDAGRRLSLFGLSRADIARIRRKGKPERQVAVRAPASGHVLFRGAGRGAFVQPGTELFTLADLSKVWFLVDVPAREAGGLRKEQLAEIHLDGQTDRTVSAPLAFISPVADSAAQMLKVRFELANTDGRLRPGLVGRALVSAEPHTAIAVPNQALIETGEHVYTFVKGAGGRFEPRLVRAGRSLDDEVEILSGLLVGEELVVDASFLLDAESRLRGTVGASEADGGAPRPGHVSPSSR